MKKLFTTALSLILALGAYADIVGSYEVTYATGKTVGNNYKFSSGEEWTVGEEPTRDDEEEEEDEPWIVTISQGEDGLQISNIVGWNETLPCTYDEATKTISIAADLCYYDGTEDSDYLYYIVGGFDGYNTGEGVISYCDANNGYIPSVATRAGKPVEFTVLDNGIIKLSSSCILTYVDYWAGVYDSYRGCPYDITLAMTMVNKDASSVKTVATDNAPAEYFNLQGMRIANPAQGQIVIKRQGNTSSKVVF